MRILMVDDSRSIAELLQMGLSEHSIEHAPDGSTALARLGEGWDLVICDGRMPGMSGPTLAARIAGRVPVLGLTGDNLCLRQFCTLGIRALAKPFQWGELERAIEETAGVQH